MVGNGANIRIWEHRWLPAERYALTPWSQPPLHGPVFVSELIDHPSATWNEPLIDELFSPPEALLIKSIPLSRHLPCDKIAWHPHKRGLFTTNSAYYVARDIASNRISFPPPADGFQVLWKTIWKAKVPKKVAVGVWRACQNILPTRERLLAKGYEGETSCLLCACPLESVEHVLADCQVARELLGAVSLQITCPVTPIFIFKEWMLECVNRVSLQQFEKFMVFLWALWNNRNAALWEDKPRLPADIAIATMSWFNEYKLVHASSIPEVKVVQRWSSPTEHVFKCNVDGSYNSHQMKGGIGCVVRDHIGDFKAGLTRVVRTASSAFQVELFALQAAVQFAISLHHEKVQFETDCLQLVQVIHAEDEDASVVGHIVEEVRGLFHNYPFFSLTHVNRRANNVAHILAQTALHSELSHTWFLYAPEFIRDAILSDIHR
ncbi:uncharacterized protein LOC133729900 [Rosa rugosa]|uniref:uncharacterized protein LOC133729900 n=1 Tax=Rosa rugosa TaxID=74645 RepID=UPI002B415DE4|nr:uncharacterized protein LOC133729900 [Rosa rugosa]